MPPTKRAKPNRDNVSLKSANYHYMCPMRLIIRSTFIALLCAGSAAVPAFAAEPAVYTGWLDNVALDGYDAMSFHDGVPLKGDPQFYFSYMGATFHFASRDSRNRFISEPERYAPAYGGYCAWAVSKGKLASGDPEQWNIKDGVLYINFSKRIKKRWEKRADKFIDRADEKWPSILSD